MVQPLALALALAVLPSAGATDDPRLASLSASLAGHDVDGLLDDRRLADCLATIDEADAWPELWLVVQVLEHESDLVMRLALAEDGTTVAADYVFRTPRRAWELGDLKRLVPEAVGRKPPRRGLNNVVIQSFTKRVRTTFVYEPRKTGEGAGGLAELLPAGSIIREARRVELPSGGALTLAVVLSEAVFVPLERCNCTTPPHGHMDSGRVMLVLASAEQIEHQLEITDRLAGYDERPSLPRYPCQPADDAADTNAEGFIERFADRSSVVLLHGTPGDPLAWSLPARPLDCDGYEWLELAVDPQGPRLELRGNVTRGIE